MIIGITGSIASGKTKILLYLKNKGLNVISLDDISHEIFCDKDVNRKIVEKMEISDITIGEIVSRKRVSEIVFKDKAKLDILNKILHPLILEKMNEYIKMAKDEKYNLFIEVPLLYELEMSSRFDKVIFVYVNEDKQIERLMERNNISKEEAIERINNQITSSKKRKIALKLNHFIIDNNGNIEDSFKQVDRILGEII